LSGGFVVAVFLFSNGDDVHRGSRNEYNQVDYDAHLSEFAIFRNDDGSVTVSHPTIGTDTLIHIDGIWSDADQSWYSIEDAIAQTPNAPITVDPAPEGIFVDDSGILVGTDGNDRLVDTSDLNGLYGGKGNDRLIGTKRMGRY